MTTSCYHISPSWHVTMVTGTFGQIVRDSTLPKSAWIRRTPLLPFLSRFFSLPTAHPNGFEVNKKWQKVPGEDVEPLQDTTEPPHTHTHSSPAATTSPVTSPENLPP
ncbi:hypothetical protein L2E82_36755 [Cichorium intybus]|uniref:Uncharacterized protein n=1 Tax=Cichorium intybus TaxID=13427 RepID=A0ACB9ACB9_CICIN|nr:hypothetical protein L2E82_36755 [Cichorium intybus]